MSGSEEKYTQVSVFGDISRSSLLIQFCQLWKCHAGKFYKNCICEGFFVEVPRRFDGKVVDTKGGYVAIDVSFDEEFFPVYDPKIQSFRPLAGNR